VASAGAVAAERRLGGGPRALRALYCALLVTGGTVALSIADGVFLAAALGFVALACLQNIRRPIFVAQLERVMDRAQRATTLSIESQARSLSVAACVPLSGWVADHYGLAWTLTAICGLGVLAALALSLGATPQVRGSFQS